MAETHYLIVTIRWFSFYKVLEETLRLHPSVGGVMRESPAPDGMKLCDYYIPAGTAINVRYQRTHM